jgi:hypothetical protein
LIGEGADFICADNIHKDIGLLLSSDRFTLRRSLTCYNDLTTCPIYCGLRVDIKPQGAQQASQGKTRALNSDHDLPQNMFSFLMLKQRDDSDLTRKMSWFKLLDRLSPHHTTITLSNNHGGTARTFVGFVVRPA